MDAPIGYSAVPTQYIRPSYRRDDDDGSGEIPNQQQGVIGEARSFKFKLDQLPIEILMIISSSLSQFEILSLLLVNKQANLIFKPSLYHKVIIDSDFSNFNNKEIDFSGITYIKSSYRLKLFFKQLIHNSNELCPLIESLSCLKLPKEIITLQLYQLLDQVFPFLSNLKELNWYNSNDIDFKLLNKLPNYCKLKKLSMNSKLSHDLQIPSNVGDNCQALESFAFTPFQNSTNLAKISSVFQFNNLKELKLARLFDKESLLIPPSSSLVTTESIWDLDLQSISQFFNSNSRTTSRAKMSLNKLSISGILIEPSDFSRLKQAIDLSKLRFLELTNISEIIKIDPNDVAFLHGINEAQWTTAMKTALHQLIEPTFMSQLAKTHVLRNVKILKIDIRQGLLDSTPTLISSLSNLQQLDIVSRWNSTKTFEFTNHHELLQKLVDSISKHSHSLKILSLELRSENAILHNEAYYSLPDDLLTRLLSPCYPNLQGLRLNTNASNLISNNEFISDCNFPNLKFLNLFGNDIYTKHMGLGVAHPGIYDEFFKIQHVVVNLLSGLDTNIEYVMIDEDKVFKILAHEKDKRVTAEPRDGIETWFKKQVRVDFATEIG